MSEDAKEYQKMCNEVLVCGDLKHGCKLTEWEINRLEEWKDQGFFSPKQKAIIERIYKEKMP
jgi:hypothetical protein